MRLWILGGLLLVLAGCAPQPRPGSTGTATPSATATAAAGPLATASPRPASEPSERRHTGLLFKLAAGTPESSAEAALPSPTLQTLPQARLDALLKRLPPLSAQAGDRKGFALRERSLPPPRTAKSITVPFPAPGPALHPPAPAAANGPLTITSAAPKGEVEMAPHMTVSFSQPMVPLSSLEQVEQKSLPVRMTPTPEGKWRWLGTQTLMFVPKIRFPMSTDYQVEIPAGTASVAGQKLAKAESFHFTTPTLTVREQQPTGGGHNLHPFLFMSFDQDVDPAKLAPFVSLTGMPGGDFPLKLVHPDTVALDPNLRAWAEAAGPHRWLALEPAQDLLAGHGYQVRLRAGAPSAEGPRTTPADQSYPFSTYDPLRLTDSSREASPGEGFYASFNNALDLAKFDPKLVQVQPELPGLKVNAVGNGLSIRGRSKGHTKYTVTVGAALVDQWGQSLGKDASFTVRVGEAQPRLEGPGRTFMTLDPQGPRQISCKVLGYKKLRLMLWKVTPADYAAFLKSEPASDGQPPKAPGTAVLDQEIETGATADEEKELKVDLGPALGSEGLGHVLVYLAPPTRKKEYLPRYYGWVQSTRLGLDVMADSNRAVAWVNNLQTGAAEPGVSVSFAAGGDKATTDKDGLASLLPRVSSPLVAQRGADSCLLPPDYGWTGGGPGNRPLWYVCDDRHLYRPGEKVHLKGWLRHWSYGPEGDLLATDAHSVRWEARDAMGNKIRAGSTPVGRLGSFQLSLDLPKTVNLGSVTIHLQADRGGSTEHSFEVQEFRRPEFEVNASASPSSSQIGQHASVTATASYFAGGPLSQAQVDWNVTGTPTSYSPPHWDGYTFGVWKPWWEQGGWRGPDTVMVEDEEAPLRVRRGVVVPLSEPGNHQALQTRTDSKGQSTLRLDFHAADPPQPYSVVATATVRDVNRQAWTTSSTLLVHPCSLYVGLKADRTFVDKGKPLPLMCVVSDLDGKAVPGKTVQVKAYREEWDEDTGQQKKVELNALNVTSAAQPVPVRIDAPVGGTYHVEARVQEGNRTNRSEMTVWVAGAKPPPSREVQQEQVTLIPAKPEFSCEEQAEVLVQAPFHPAELLVTTRRNGIASVQRLSAPEGTATLHIPLKEAYIPGLHLQVDAVGQQSKPDKGVRPAYATGSLQLNISKAKRKLLVDVQPGASQLRPGERTTVTVNLKDSGGKPVQGDVAVFMVDESVLALTGYNPADPLDSFCAVRSPDVVDGHSRQFVLLREAPTNEGAVDDREAKYDETVGSAGGGAARAPMAKQAMRTRTLAPALEEADAPAEPAAAAPLKLRTDFTPLALYAPSVATDAHGRARVPVHLPDNLTRYRLIALAAAGARQFGKGESTLVARQPLMIRPSLPRFLNFGDQARLPVVVQNQSDVPMLVDLGCRASNARLEGRSSAGYQFHLKGNERVQVEIPCATDRAGTARFQFAASSASGSDAAEVSLPVWTPATTEAFATYGVVDNGAVSQPIEKPKDVFPEFGGLTLTTSSTALSELTDAFLYLTSYPYECSEQVSSRMLAAAAIRDVLQAFQAPGLPSASELQAAMVRDVARLRGLQQDDGGWDYWRRDRPTIPYLSCHVTHALVRAKSKGYAVDEEMLGRACGYLTNIESHFDPSYGEETKRSIRAYALYVLDLAGHPNSDKARKLYAELPEDAVEARGWLLPTLHKDKAGASMVAEILRYFENHITQTAADAQFTAGYHDQDYLLLYSDRRDDAVVLESLMEARPDSPLVPKLVRGLLDHRSEGRWANTQENAWVLLALDRYFHQFEGQTPDFVARVWLGQGFAGEQRFRGRNKDENVMQIPVGQLNGALTLAKEGAGRLYYRMGLTYAPKDFRLPALDQGFHVERTYEAVKDNRDVRKDADGTWHVKAGAEVRVSLTMQAPSRRYHVALVDPLPAGFEALNPALLGQNGQTAMVRTSTPRYSWDWGYSWFTHENLRDERVEAFTQLLWEGVYTYSYVARATTRGTFVVPPTKAEEMYHPETFGRSKAEKVVVE